MFLFRSLGLAILVSATFLHGDAMAASIVAPLHWSADQVQLVSGCGIGAHRGPGYNCPRVFPRAHPRVYEKRYVRHRHHNYRKSYRRRRIVRSKPYVKEFHIPLFGPQCGLGYDISCIFDVCWRRCW